MFKTLDDFDAKARRVLVRVDLNVPMADGKVTDETRLVRIAPTLTELADKGAKVIALSHFGRPKGKRVADMSLAPVAEALGRVLGRKVAFAPDCIGPEAEKAVAAMDDGDILVLENLRYHDAEEANEEGFAKALAALGDVYVNDAFSAAHRAHASTFALAKLLPAYAGRNMQAELEALNAALGEPKRPVMAVVGGAKVSSKLAVLGHLVDKVDYLVIGGGMANTFLSALGTDVGKSLCEPALAPIALEILGKADAAGCRVVLPSDAVTAKEFKAGAATETVPVGAVGPEAMILDIGPDSVAALTALLGEVRTVLWNGPLGAFEIPPFDVGTSAVAQAAAERAAAGTLTAVAGGGDTVAALAHAGAVDRFTYVSTAGGAFLEWMEGKELPGVAALG